jgi:hypothetical protein
VVKIDRASWTLMGPIVGAAPAVPMPAAADELVPLMASESGAFALLGFCEPGDMVIDVTRTGEATLLSGSVSSAGAARRVVG